MGRKGRPRKNAPRVNGRLKQVQDKSIVPERVIAMRKRAGIPEDKARSLGTMEDALLGSKLIDTNQYHAARHYIMLRIKYCAALDNPHVRQDARKPTGNGPDAYIDFCDNIKEQYKALNDAVLLYQRDKKLMRANLVYALQCISDPFGQWLPPDSLEDLQHALDAVHNYLHPRKERAA